jgi:hypothetical protein
MGEFVRQQAHPDVVPWLVASRRERDVLAHGIGICVQCAGAGRSGGVGMNPHIGEVVSESCREVALRISREGLSRRL